MNFSDHKNQSSPQKRIKHWFNRKFNDLDVNGTDRIVTLITFFLILSFICIHMHQLYHYGGTHDRYLKFRKKV